MPTSAEVRERLATELRLDLIGPGPEDGAVVDEILPDPPPRWYLTGFLVPLGAPERQKSPDPQEEMDTAEERWGRRQRVSSGRSSSRATERPSTRPGGGFGYIFRLPPPIALSATTERLTRL